MASRPPPPDPYETWLDSVLDGHIPESPYGRARAELAELRAEIERLKAEPRTCLVCGVIMHEPTPDPADEYLMTARAAIDMAKGTK